MGPSQEVWGGNQPMGHQSIYKSDREAILTFPCRKCQRLQWEVAEAGQHYWMFTEFGKIWRRNKGFEPFLSISSLGTPLSLKLICRRCTSFPAECCIACLHVLVPRHPTN